MALFFPLRTTIEGAGVLVVESPPSHFVKRGLLAVLLVPVLVALLALLLGLAADDGEAILVGLGAFAGVVVLAGLTLIALAPILSRRTRVRFDGPRGVVVRERDGLTVPLRDVAGVVLRPRGGLAMAQELVVVRADGAPLVTLHAALASTHTAQAQGIASAIHAFFGAPPAAVAAPYRYGAPPPAAIDQGALGLAPNVAAGLCYLPIQGIFVLVSIVMLIGAKHPAVRFAAKQSLLQLALALVVGVVVLGGAAGAVIATDTQNPVAIASVIALVIAFALWHVGAYIVACVRAFRGRTWVMPWLRWAIGKSAPEAPMSRAT